MGGHGGLNILPQKKWNVYNYDNRAIVEKDKKIAAQKLKEKKQQDRQKLLMNKLSVLKDDNSQQTEKTEKTQKKYHSLLTQQLQNLEQQKKHINLFEKQQKILENRDIMEIKRLQQAQFLKDKNMDYSSRFLGTYGQDKAQPWYTKSKNIQQEASIKRKKYKDAIYMELRDFNEDLLQRQRSRDKKPAPIMKLETNKLEKECNIDKMRLDRLRRQQKQRQRAERLKTLKKIN